MAPGTSPSALAVLRLCRQSAPRLLVLVVALTVVHAAVPPATLVVLQRLVDEFAAGRTGTAMPLILGLGLLAVVHSTTLALINMKQTELAARVNIASEQRLVEIAARAPLTNYYDSSWYDAVTRARDGVQWRPPLAMATVMELVGAVVTAGGMVVIISTLDARMLVLAVLAALPVLVYRRSEARALYRVRRDNTVLERQRDYYFDLLLRPELAKDVRAYGLATPFAARHAALGARAVGRELRVQWRFVGMAALSGLLGGAFLLVAYPLVGVGAAGEGVSAGTLFLVFTAFTALTTSVTETFGIVVALEEHATYLADYFDLVASAAPAPQPLRQPPADEPPDVEFREVWYTYPGGTPGVCGLSFTVMAGELVAMMGANGAGKSTVVKLMLGLLQPDKGTVLLGGRDVAELGAERTRALVGVLFQEYGRYEFPLSEAVRLGRVEEPLDLGRMWEALEHAGLGRVVEELPQGTSSPVGGQFPGGRDLSGGQWQRLALARVLYRDAPLWILDEPTAALDVAAEVAFLHHLRNSRLRRTTLIVTHRVDTARDADRILVLRDGRLAEQGTHAELMAHAGEYHAYRSALRAQDDT